MGDEPAPQYMVYRPPQNFVSGDIWSDYQELGAPFQVGLVGIGRRTRLTATSSVNATKVEIILDGDSLYVAKDCFASAPKTEHPVLKLLPMNKLDHDISWLAFADELLTFTLKNGTRISPQIEKKDEFRIRDLFRLQQAFQSNIDALLGENDHAMFTSDVKMESISAGTFWPHYRDLKPPIRLFLEKGEKGIDFGLEGDNEGCFAVSLRDNQVEVIVADPENSQRPRPVYKNELEEKIAAMKFANQILILVKVTEDLAPSPTG